MGAWRHGQPGSGPQQGVSVPLAAIHSALSHIFVFLEDIYTLGCYLTSAPHAIMAAEMER